MAHAEICPVCKGSGKVNADSTAYTIICHGYGGKGWVSVPDSWYPASCPVYPIPYPVYLLYP